VGPLQVHRIMEARDSRHWSYSGPPDRSFAPMTAMMMMS
jgi:hypothetical protein